MFLGIQRKFNLLISSFVLFMVLAAGSVLILVDAQSSDAAGIGIAARQQVLLIKITQQTQALIAALESESDTDAKRKELNQNVDLFDHSLLSLKRGGSVFDLDGKTVVLPPADSSAQTFLIQTEHYWISAHVALKILLDPKTKPATDPFYDAQHALPNLWKPLEENSTQVATLLKENSQAKVLNLKGVMLLILMLTLFLALAGFSFGKTYIINPIKIMRNAVNELRDGDGDLTRRLPHFGKNEIGQTADALNGFLNKIQLILLESSKTLEIAFSAAQEINHHASCLSDVATKQAASLEETSASLEQISSAMQETSHGAIQAESLAKDVSLQAEESLVLWNKPLKL
jgi:hypothetical protein